MKSLHVRIQTCRFFLKYCSMATTSHLDSNLYLDSFIHM
jgi:hypothetical protein